jgi:quinohemoprotein ethanol dehydrogenase
MTVHPVDDPKIQISAADAAKGHDLFIRCVSCHGFDLVSMGSPAPDLRESRVALDPDSFYSVVHGGMLLQAGMPRFDDLSRAQVMQLYAYVRQGAREAIASQKTAGQSSKPAA